MTDYIKPDRPYIDCHNHIGRTLDRVPKVGQSTTMCLARYAETNIYAAISAPPAVGTSLARGTLDVRDQNEVIVRAGKDFPGVFPVALALMEPRFGDVAVEELEWALSNLGMHGMVGHPPINEWCIPFVEATAARGGLINLHLCNELLLRIAQICPDATYIVHGSRWAVENLGHLKNCWFEVVQYPDWQKGDRDWDFEWMASKLGSDRIVFGADMPYYDYRYLQQKIERAPISDELKDKIAFRNAQALIKRFVPNWQMPDAPPRAPRIYPAEELWKKNPSNPERMAAFG